jgi:hypothetical protein
MVVQDILANSDRFAQGRTQRPQPQISQHPHFQFDLRCFPCGFVNFSAQDEEAATDDEQQCTAAAWGRLETKLTETSPTVELTGASVAIGRSPGWLCFDLVEFQSNCVVLIFH